MKSLAELFPNASASTVAANPHLVATTTGSCNKNDVQTILEPRRGKRGLMNKTESEFALQLEAQKRNGEILRWEYEPVTLRFAGVKYTPDFGVWRDSPSDLRFIEVKGAWTKGKFERAIERFRHARTYYDGFFHFQLWQKTKDGWGTPKI